MPLRRPAGALLVLLAAGMAPGAVPPGGPQPPAATLDRLGWLGGCFEMRKGELVVEEQRMRARGGSMLGMSRTTSAKGLVEYELTLIRQVAGTLVYEARPSGQAVAVFTALVISGDSAVFSNPQHDYPQVVGYRRAGADSIIAWIDGKSRGRERRIEFPYRRVACPGVP